MSLDTTFPAKEHVVRVHARVFPSQIKFLDIVAFDEKIGRSEVLRVIIERFQKQYFHRKGEFTCQSCGKPRKNKERHDIQIENDIIGVGDCCYYNDAYKELIRRII